MRALRQTAGEGDARQALHLGGVEIQNRLAGGVARQGVGQGAVAVDTHAHLSHVGAAPGEQADGVALEPQLHARIRLTRLAMESE